MVGAGVVRHREEDGYGDRGDHHQEGHARDEDEPPPDGHHQEVDQRGPQPRDREDPGAARHP